MASYKKDEKTGKWCVRFRIKDYRGKTVAKRIGGFAKKGEAEQAYVDYMNSYRYNGKEFKLTFNQLFEEYKLYKAPLIKDSSFIEYCIVLKNHILSYFGDKKVVELTPPDVLRWKNEICKGKHAHGFRKKMHTVFVDIYRYAQIFYDLPGNPVQIAGSFIGRGTKTRKRITNFWTEEEFRKFLAVINDFEWKIFFTMFYLTGARRGEILALNWLDIDFNGNRISITKSHTSTSSNGPWAITSTKSESAERYILMPKTLKQLLLAFKEYRQKLPDFREIEFIFGRHKPFVPETIDKRKDMYIKLADVKRITLHDFRHSHASLLINRGADPLIVAERLGHKDVSLTLKTYSHLYPSRQQELINLLEIPLQQCDDSVQLQINLLEIPLLQSNVSMQL